MDCSDHIVIYLEWKYELYTTINGLFWSYCDLPWMEVWTVYNYQWIVLIILWFTLSGSMNCIQLEMDCSDHVIYLEWKNELHTTINGLFWSYCDLPWVEVWTVYNYQWIVLIILCFTLNGMMNLQITIWSEQSIDSCIQFILPFKVNHKIRTTHF
jgi:hypothetical protein